MLKSCSEQDRSVDEALAVAVSVDALAVEAGDVGRWSLTIHLGIGRELSCGRNDSSDLDPELNQG